MFVNARVVIISLFVSLLLFMPGCEAGNGNGEQVQQASNASGNERSERRAPAAAGEDGAVVLMYHRFGEDRFPSTSVRMEQFRFHLEYLDDNDFNVWPVERVVEYLLEGKTFPSRTVAITIDDAYRSIYEEAYPLLKERDWPYLVFVNTDGADSGGSYMSWDQMREMAENSRVSFANHSATHDYLVTRREGENEHDWRRRVRADIEKAERRLQEEVGDHVPDSPRLHAYPYGEYDSALQSLVEEMGYVAFGQHSGPVGHHSDRLALPRFAMAENYADPDDFRLRVNTRPFPIVRVSPKDPTAIDQENPPELKLEFAETEIALDRINCFASGRGVELAWVSESPRILSVRADGPLAEGRSRYNCTAPAQGGGFHWFSFQWVKGRL
ncbi:polysaccharide deacetylase family protein [Natronospira bacteriovora]|uniref:Polysaccharide deacetylase family protein n=1 Tax=Natronospira bacteriovora TaxID=3069753 RepID=A0ABU0W698_9GAMM|nr:polysaccharide deacetylase family protein [Natronospira sp. AB-CW4]MDQ2068520.1 polysaccharide deacetylase family protein [Natronospira sp. AB-CW4]